VNLRTAPERKENVRCRIVVFLLGSSLQGRGTATLPRLAIIATEHFLATTVWLRLERVGRRPE
jgi:hypothetical protein